MATRIAPLPIPATVAAIAPALIAVVGVEAILIAERQWQIIVPSTGTTDNGTNSSSSNINSTCYRREFALRRPCMQFQ